MGQRSQIYIRYNSDYNKQIDRFAKQYLVARYFQWNYAERMASRARGLIEWIIDHAQYREYEFHKLPRVAEINWDMRDVVDTRDIVADFIEGMESYYKDKNINDIIFNDDNNDGKLLIDVLDDGKVKYAFLDYDNKLLGDAEAYMNWDRKSWYDKTSPYYEKDCVEYTERNIEFIRENAILMTEEEVEEYLNADYSFLLPVPKF